MPRTPSPHLWSSYTLAGHRFQLLNLDHPEIATRVLGDLDAGIAVYYDSRWDLTTRFCRFLLTHPAWIVGRSVLVLGAGIGLETLVIGRLCTTLYVNDRAPGWLGHCCGHLQLMAGDLLIHQIAQCCRVFVAVLVWYKVATERIDIGGRHPHLFGAHRR